jgi:hypothetical protein
VEWTWRASLAYLEYDKDEASIVVKTIDPSSEYYEDEDMI